MSQFNINSKCSEYESAITITGQIFDTVSHETLPFANVYLSSNTDLGTAANEDGIFTIDVPNGSTLTASFVGYHNYEFIVKQGFTKVFLTPDDQLGTVYLEGENKKSKNNWFWWLLFGGMAVKAIASTKEQTTTSRKPIKAKI